jgi:hypothetical protein
MTATLCQQIKAKLTLREAARLVNVTLPDRDGVKFCSPLRPDKSPSCSIKGELFTDWSTNQHLDAIDFYAAAKGMSTPEAIRELAERYGIEAAAAGKVHVAPAPDTSRPQARQQSPAIPSAIAHANMVVAGPDLIEVPGEPEDADFEAVRASRLLPEGTGGLELAHYIGVLRFGMVCGFPSWIVTDSSNRAAEARRLDGEHFPQSGPIGERKAHTIKGSTKGWPVGLLPRMDGPQLANLRHTPLVVVEGGPDLLAAFCILAQFPASSNDVHPVAMLGTGATISDEALTLMAGRPAVILAHGEKAGRDAASRWGEQLTSAGCSTRIRQLPDSKDLNDMCLNRTTLEPLARLLLP